MSELDDTLNNWQSWGPRMQPPASFSRLDAREFQKRIDSITGTKDGRPLIKLAWAPDELRWRPYCLGDEPPGYTFPIFFFGWDENSEEVAAPRWVLLQRLEPPQFQATWEAGRFSVYDNRVWDWKGPCPTERYVELRAHCYHDGTCCPCHGAVCQCPPNEFKDHCWGHYRDPDTALLDWVQWAMHESLKDADIDPNADVRYFTAPNAQRELASQIITGQEKKAAHDEAFSDYMLSHWERKPHSTNGLKRTESGIILLS